MRTTLTALDERYLLQPMDRDSAAGIDPLLVAEPGELAGCAYRWRFRGAWVTCGQIAGHKTDHVHWSDDGQVVSTRARRDHRTSWSCSECGRGARAASHRWRLGATCGKACAKRRKLRLQNERRAAARAT